MRIKFSGKQNEIALTFAKFNDPCYVMEDSGLNEHQYTLTSLDQVSETEVTTLLSSSRYSVDNGQQIFDDGSQGLNQVIMLSAISSIT